MIAAKKSRRGRRLLSPFRIRFLDGERVRLNPFTLAFDDSKEKDFLQQYFYDSLWQVRSALILVSILYGVFGWLDAVIVPAYQQTFHFIRFGVVVPVLLTIFAISFTPLFKKAWQALLLIAFVVAGLGISAMLIMVPENHVYYGGLLLIFFAGYFFIKLRFFYATIAGWATLLFYNAGAIFLSDTPVELIVNNNFFYLAANVIGMVAAYRIEFFSRRDYFLKKQLDARKVQIEEANKTLEQKVHTRTEELREAKERAEQSDKLKSAFLANMSHEIRTPMNGILGFAQLLRQSEDPAEKEEYLDIIDENGQHLLSLINDIIDLSKIEIGMLQVSHSEFSLNLLLQEVHDMFSGEDKVNSGQVELRVSNELLQGEDAAVADRTRIKQVLINLVSNAIKFTHKGFVEAGYAIFDDDVLFFVQDTGTGIKKDQQAVIFDRFMQITMNHHQTEHGSGLGLAISKAIVQLMGGQIWVDSIPGEGSVFYFSLPYKQGSHAEFERSKERKGVMEYDWTNKLILVAEDVKVNYLVIEKALQRTGVSLLWVKNGQEAIETCRIRDDIDLILMDIRMPVKDGYEATREIRKENKDLPIIAQTSYAMSEDRQYAIDAGCNDYIAKPFKLPDLLEKIDQFIKS